MALPEGARRMFGLEFKSTWDVIRQWENPRMPNRWFVIRCNPGIPGHAARFLRKDVFDIISRDRSHEHLSSNRLCTQVQYERDI